MDPLNAQAIKELRRMASQVSRDLEQRKKWQAKTHPDDRHHFDGAISALKTCASILRNRATRLERGTTGSAP